MTSFFRSFFRTLPWRRRAETPPREALIPWQLVRVSGPSMVPALRSGDCLLVRRGGSVRAGAVVLARFPSLPDRLVVKRAVRPAGAGWWLVSDNPFAGSDSAVHGVGEVLGPVVLVLPGGRWRPRRVAAPR